MALTRINAFATGTILTNGQLTGEFDNIYNNALTLISPLTANLSFGGFNANNIALGSAASPSINWTGNTNTGLYSAGANQVSIAVAGVGAASFTSAAAGPHVIGSATTNTRYALNLTGTVTLSGATQEAGFASDQALTNASGVNLYGMYLAPTLTNVAGATTTMAWLGISPGALTITAGSVTNAAGLYIAAAPSGATNNYALWAAGGTVRFDGSLIFGASGSLLSAYTTGSFTFTATGMTTSPTGTAFYTRIGNAVTILVPSISGTSNATTFTLTGLPVALTPSRNNFVVLSTTDNGAAAVAALGVLAADGTFTLYANVNTNAFTASGTKAVNLNTPVAVTYVLN